jgi:hypothetical protein
MTSPQGRGRITAERQYVERVFDAFVESHDFNLLPTSTFLGFVGSKSHGTYTPPDDPDTIDDIDMMGVVVPPPLYAMGLHNFEHWTLQRDELDVVVYSLDKFVRLLLKGNPNVLGLLWLRAEDNLSVPEWWTRLVAHREWFAAKSVYASFAGYASGQFARMTSYSPAIDAEIQALEATLTAAGWYTSEIMDGRSLPMPKGLTPQEANDKAQRLRSLRAKYHAAYMGEKRRGLVRRHGYDTKNAAHLIRLLAMCEEFLLTGNLRVYRDTDAEMLKAIKRGEWELDAVKAHAEDLFARCRTAKDQSVLPDEPDFNKASRFVAETHYAAFCPEETPR